MQEGVETPGKDSGKHIKSVCVLSVDFWSCIPIIPLKVEEILPEALPYEKNKMNTALTLKLVGFILLYILDIYKHWLSYFLKIVLSIHVKMDHNLR